MASKNMVAGVVNNPEQGANGAAKLYVHQHDGGSVCLHRPATMAEAVAWAFAFVNTKEQLDAVLDEMEKASYKLEERFVEGREKDKLEKAIGTPTAPVAPVAKPVPVSAPVKPAAPSKSKPAPVASVAQTVKASAPAVSKAADDNLPYNRIVKIGDRDIPAPASKPAPQAKAAPAPAPAVKVAPSIPAPATYAALVKLGKDTVFALAEHHGIATTNVGWGKVLGAVWAKVKPATVTAPKADAKPAQKAAAQTVATVAPKVTAPADPIVPGCFGQDGKPLTLSAVMNLLGKLGKSAA